MQEQNLVTVLIDGDGAIFDYNLLKQGRLGGKTAAALLRERILEAARDKRPNLNGREVNIIAQICEFRRRRAGTFY